MCFFFFDEEEDPSKAHPQEEVGKVHRVSNSVQQSSDVGTSWNFWASTREVFEKVPQGLQIDRKPQQGNMQT